MHAPEATPRPGWRAPLLWGLAAAAAGAVAAPLDPNLLEEGIVVHAAERMAAGEHLYRDIILHTAPLPYELLALLFRIFGAKIAVARGAVVGLQALGTGMLFAALRRAAPAPTAHAGAAVLTVAPILLVPLFSTFYYTTVAFYLSLVAVYAAVRVGDAPASRSPGWALAAGALVGAVALCKQSTGVVLAAALLPGLLRAAPDGRRLRCFLCYAAGGAAMAVATVGLYAARGDLGALIFGQVELTLAIAGDDTFRAPYINVWPLGRLAPAVRENWVMYLPSFYHMRYGLYAVIGSGMVVLTQLLYLLPVVVLGATALRVLPFFRGARPVLWIHGAMLATMTLNLYPRADWGHLVVALPPALVQTLLLATASVPRQAPGRGTRLLAGATILVLAAGGVYTGVWLHAIAGEPRFGPRVPLRPVSRAYRTPAVPRVIAYVRRKTRPDESIYVPRQEPLIYFATERRNPTPFPGILPGFRELQEPIILEALKDVRVVVMSDIDQPIYTYYADELPGVEAYLERHFRIPPDFPIDDWSWILVLTRGPDRGPTAVDLIEERSRARAWIRDRRGEIREPREVPQRLAARQLRRPLPVSLGALGGGLDYELEIPEGAVFQAGVGYRGLVSVDHQYIHPRGTTLAVSVSRDGTDFEQLAAVRVDDRPEGGRRWTPISADLSAYAGERVTLRLEVKAEQPLRGDRLAWWGSPRIALPPPAPGR
jgi:hypothetical protein